MKDNNIITRQPFLKLHNNESKQNTGNAVKRSFVVKKNCNCKSATRSTLTCSFQVTLLNELTGFYLLLSHMFIVALIFK